VPSPSLPRIWWGVGAALTALIIAGAAAFVVAPDGHLAFGVESASSAASALGQRPIAVFPQAYALFAGMVAAFNPCGFALLPAYLGLYLQTGSDGPRSPAAVIFTPLKVSLAVAAAFVGAFGLVGLAIGAAGATVSSLFPFLGLAVGMLLIAAGGAMVAGWTFVGTGQGLADRLGGVATRRGIAGYFAYGIAYALASLGCTLPVFLTVVGSALLTGGWVGELLQFVLFGIGMSLVLAALTLLAALFKTQLLLRLRVVGRIVEPLSAALLLAVGAYILYYWLTLGGLVRGAA
jgi:cytochrome c-type biogenesis protein